MRKKIVAGNWKMNKSQNETISFINEINEKKELISKDVELIIFPASIYISTFKELVSNEIRFGAQNCASTENGAFTGEISANMLQEICCSYTIVGHSERRGYFNETEDTLSKKVNLLLNKNITPVYCCGESLKERETNNHFQIVNNQVKNGLFHLTKDEIQKTVVAYEPVWAIGTGKTASSVEAQEMHAYIRLLIKDQYDSETADSISILYGGSCKPSNAKELFACEDVDGGLIGGASLEVESFLKIANSF